MGGGVWDFSFVVLYLLKNTVNKHTKMKKENNANVDKFWVKTLLKESKSRCELHMRYGIERRRTWNLEFEVWTRLVVVRSYTDVKVETQKRPKVKREVRNGDH